MNGVRSILEIDQHSIEVEKNDPAALEGSSSPAWRVPEAQLSVTETPPQTKWVTGGQPFPLLGKQHLKG